MVQFMIQNDGPGNAEVQTAATSSYSWQDHLLPNSKASIELTKGGWSHVILQNLSGAATEASDYSLEDFLADGRALRDLAYAFSPEAQLVLYEPWARYPTHLIYNEGVFVPGGAREMQRQIREAYAQLARDLGVIVAPVGDAVEHCVRNHPELSIYGADKYHLNILGSYLAASVIYATIYETDPRGLPTMSGISANDAASVQEIAWETVKGFWGWSRKTGLGYRPGLHIADPDQDRLNNLEEYAMGTNPLLRNTPPIRYEISKEDGHTYQTVSTPWEPKSTDVTVRVRRSSNLIDWIELGAIQGGTPQGSGLVEQIVYGTEHEAVFRDTQALESGTSILVIDYEENLADEFPPPVDSGIFQAHDIGGCAVEGITTYHPETDTYVLQGSGTNMFYATDLLHYAHTTMTGDGTITARITSTSSPTLKAGVMMRENLRSDSPHAACLLTNGSIAFHRRPELGANTKNTQTKVSAPWWVRLTRDSATHTFTAERSQDGVHWTVLNTEVVVMPDEIEVGLFVCGQSDQLQTTEFKELQMP